MKDCTLCPVALARAAETGDRVECACGRLYGPPVAAAEQPTVTPTARRPIDLLALLLRDLAGTARLDDEERVPTYRGRSPLAVVGDRRDDVPDPDALTEDAQNYLRFLLTSDTKGAQRKREELFARISSLPGADENEPWDVDAARAAYARLASTEGLLRDVLYTLRANCTPRTSWETAANLLADAFAPAETRAAWERLYGAARTPGRPRRDPTALPPEVARQEYGSGLLEHVVKKWFGRP